MKKTSIRLLLMFAVSAILLGACKKDKDAEPVAVTKENLAGKYKATEIKGKAAGVDYDVYNEVFEACERDDIYTLNADFTAKYEDAGTKCDANGSSSYDTEWELDGNNIVIRGNSMDYIGVVKSFDGTTLVIEGSADFMGMSTSFRAVLKKQ
ncbi:lipocalin family protein [Pseudoflavitalea sp. X16]|uniref:lipocalin family protein n=1 Tax=Paraflavitalea devenefica TaxID=2716334 RepID=UPI001421C206|nr:lipocalin family protein [Paraflavitalea devenefica]NII24956.1 lipocalin family protein [Paraflavitalea devenefica]